jgi:hypothetical protein
MANSASPFSQQRPQTHYMFCPFTPPHRTRSASYRVQASGSGLALRHFDFRGSHHVVNVRAQPYRLGAQCGVYLRTKPTQNRDFFTKHKCD